MQKWEYKILICTTNWLTGGVDPFDDETKLNDMGKFGWELVSTEMDHGTKIVYIFKRMAE